MNPVLVEVLRGAGVESPHRGAVAVYDADGKAVREIGGTERPLFPRAAGDTRPRGGRPSTVGF